MCKPCNVAKVSGYWATRKSVKSAYDAQYREKNKEHLEKIKLAYYAVNRDAIKEKTKKWCQENKERAREYKRLHFQENRAAHYEKMREWKKQNPGKVNAETAKRRARKHSATPRWANPGKIKDIYAEARRARSHVDHIVPLRSTLVCGLHCEANLQVLPPSENHKKSNRHWPDMP